MFTSSTGTGVSTASIGAIESGTGDNTATLSGTTNVDGLKGVAKLSGLSIDKPASGYKLTAAVISVGGYGAFTALSASFDISPQAGSG